jgi:iron complex outermembrane recepter protein
MPSKLSNIFRIHSTLKLGVSVSVLAFAMAGAYADDSGSDGQSSSTHPIETVVVTGTAENGYRVDEVKSVGLLGEMATKDIPYSINVTSSDMLENTDAHNMAEALKTNPTVYVTKEQFTNKGGMNDALIRGFSPQYLLDGLYVNAFNMPSTENVDRIEVMNGLGGFFYGFSEPGLGGSINYITKQPTEKRIVDIKAGGYGAGQYYAALDLGGQVNDGSKITYRANFFASDGDTFIDRQRYNSLLASAALRYQFAKDSYAQIYYYHNQFSQKGSQAQFVISDTAIAVPRVPARNVLYGQPWLNNSVSSEQFGIKFSTKLSDVFSIRFHYHHSKMVWYEQSVKATLIDNAGNYTEKFNFDYGPLYYITDTGNLLVDAKFSTAGIDHKVTFGVWSIDNNEGGAPSGSMSLGTFNMYSPSYVDRVQYETSTEDTVNSWYCNSFILGDNITIDDQWSVLAGVTWAWYDDHKYDYPGKVLEQNFSQKHLSPSLSVLYKPVENMTVYATYLEGMVGGYFAPETYNGVDVKNANELLSPMISRQYELGTKVSIGKLDVSAALFHINNASDVFDPSDSVYKIDGREIHQGGELYVTGKLTDDLTVTGGFTMYDAHVEKAEAIPLTEGKTPTNIPKSYGSLRFEYAIPQVQNLYVSAGAKYIARRPINNYDTQYISSVTTYDMGLRYRLNLDDHPLSFTLNVTNLLNKKYWSSYRSGLEFGAPRLVAFSVKTAL